MLLLANSVWAKLVAWPISLSAQSRPSYQLGPHENAVLLEFASSSILACYKRSCIASLSLISHNAMIVNKERCAAFLLAGKDACAPR